MSVPSTEQLIEACSGLPPTRPRPAKDLQVGEGANEAEISLGLRSTMTEEMAGKAPRGFVDADLPRDPLSPTPTAPPTMPRSEESVRAFAKPT